jgi:hypothetical protein
MATNASAAPLSVAAPASGAGGRERPPLHYTLEQYASALDRLRSLIESNHLDVARSEAQSLIGAEVSGPLSVGAPASGARPGAGAPTLFTADRSLLDEVAALKGPNIHVRERLATTAAELRRSAGIAVPAQDVALLDRLRAEQTVVRQKEGGEVILPQLQNLTLMERIAEWTGKALKWIGDKLTDFFEWLAGFWPKSKLPKPAPTSGLRWMVVAVVTLIIVVIVVLAVEVIRRGQARTDLEALESEPISSRRDDDPLSRGATEWERYASQLAAAGRIREAIRAWYHAVLVTLYAAGILSFRKGRTNWEYVSALGPSIRWRGEFVTLTRHFEHQWYGAEQSPAEALDEVSRRARGILDSVRRGAA